MMDQSKALHRLREAADLVGMIEDLLHPARTETLSPASWAGMRVTLREIKDSMIESHTVLTKDLVNRARSAAQSAPTEKPSAAAITASNPNTASNGTSQMAIGERKLGASPIQRQTLTSSVERFNG